MAYGGTKTWAVGDSWPITDANTYIRDNFNSVRNFQRGDRTFFDQATGIGTSYVTVATHLTLLPATPDEAYEMHVRVLFGMLNPSGGTSYGLMDVFDESGAVDISITGGHMDWEFPAPSQVFTRVPAFVLGKKTYAAGTNAGFVVKARTNTGTMDLDVYTEVTFRPLT